MRALNWMMVPALVVMAACDNSATGPSGDQARMQMAAAGDDGAAMDRSPDGARFTASSAQGTVSFDARAYVQTSTGAWVELTDGAFEQVAVAANSASGNARVFASGNVQASSYTRVRLVFRDIDANVQGGVTVGGSLLTGTVTVNAGSDGEVVVERAISVNASAGSTVRLLLDLNSNVWLNQASASSHTVSETAFASALALTAQ